MHQSETGILVHPRIPAKKTRESFVRDSATFVLGRGHGQVLPLRIKQTAFPGSESFRYVFRTPVKRGEIQIRGRLVDLLSRTQFASLRIHVTNFDSSRDSSKKKKRITFSTLWITYLLTRLRDYETFVRIVAKEILTRTVIILLFFDLIYL